MSLDDYIRADVFSTDAKPRALTEKMLTDAFEMALKDSPRCGSPERPHLVSSRAQDEGHLMTVCGNCLFPVLLREPTVEELAEMDAELAALLGPEEPEE